ncbi:MAG: exo-alpha-sialidase [Phycisphaerales bacterium]|nr:MAG: exo-alpha-sialidase [Phycisphaerales bacterium]
MRGRYGGTVVLLGVILLGTAAAGPVDPQGRPLIRTLGTIDCDLVETTPIVFQGKLYRCEWVRTSYKGNELGENYSRLVEVETGKSTTPLARGCAFSSAFVDGDTIYVTATSTEQGWTGQRVEMFASTDLKKWEHWTALDLDGFGICNTSICKADDRYVMMFEIHKPKDQAGAVFTARFATSKDLRRWEVTPPECVYAKDRYTAPHCLRYLEGYFYDFYLEAYEGYEMRVVRSQDLIHWEPSPLNPVLKASPEDKQIANPQLTAEQRERIAKAENINNSDIDFCFHNGRLVINYSWGNQRGEEFLAQAVYDGTVAEFLHGWFPTEDRSTEMRPLLIIEPSEEYPRHSEGDIIELNDGRLCLIYTRFDSKSGDHSPADLVRRLSDDGGKTWSPPQVAVAQTGGLNVMSVSLLRLASGEIALFYLRKTSREDCRPVMRLSTDETQTWSEPTVCITDEVGYYVMNNDRATQLESGRLVLPVAWHQGPGKPRDNQGIIMGYLSDDNGKTWRRSKDTFKGYGPDGQRVLVQEPGVIELVDGRLMMYMRTDAGSQYICYSRDGGETWAKAKPSELASPRSPASIKRVPWTGDLVCVWNDHSGQHPYTQGRRTPLCAAISNDEGMTWSPSRAIETNPDGWYCYTAITFVKDRMLLAYCAGDKQVGGLNRLKVVAISKDDLR